MFTYIYSYKKYVSNSLYFDTEILKKSFCLLFVLFL